MSPIQRQLGLAGYLTASTPITLSGFRHQKYKVEPPPLEEKYCFVLSVVLCAIQGCLLPLAASLFAQPLM